MKDILQDFVKWTKLKIRIHLSDRIIYFKEREIWWASLGVNIAFEQNGKNETFERPILVLKKFNHDVLWMLPMTSQEKSGKYYYPVDYNGEKFYLVLSQLRLISSKRLLRKVRTITSDEFNDIRSKVKNIL